MDGCLAWLQNSDRRRRARFAVGGCVSREILLNALAVPFWLALAFTLAMALVPRPPSALFVAGDKNLHMAVFTALSALASLAFPRWRVIELFVAMAALGASIEVLQMIPALGRDAELADWIADCVAVAVTLATVKFARKIAGTRITAHSNNCKRQREL